jgi:hypothetical protein
MRSLVPALVICVFAAAGCSSRIEWARADQHVYCSEDGHAITLLRVDLHNGNAFTPWRPVLVEPSGTAKSPLPTWQEDPHQPMLAEIDAGMPDYREVNQLFRVAEGVNPEFATNQQVWIVGTRPFAIAACATRQPSTAPGLVKVAEGAVFETRHRDAKLVSPADLSVRVNQVLILPEAVTPNIADRFMSTGPSDQKARIFQLREPMTIEALIDLLADEETLAKHASHMIEAPVAWH